MAEPSKPGPVNSLNELNDNHHLQGRSAPAGHGPGLQKRRLRSFGSKDKRLAEACRVID
jgi:hypothetical protein